MNAVRVAQRWFERVWRERDFDAIDELMAPDAVGVLPTGRVVGPAEFKEVALSFLSAMPDFRLEVSEIVGTAEEARIRWTVTGTHTGRGLGIEPTQKRVVIQGQTRMVVKDGTIVGGEDEWDYAGLMAYLSESG